MITPDNEVGRHLISLYAEAEDQLDALTEGRGSTPSRVIAEAIDLLSRADALRKDGYTTCAIKLGADGISEVKPL